MLEGGVPSEGGNYYNPTPSTTEPGNTVEPPGPAEDDSTSLDRPRTDSSVLNLVLPEETKVFINDTLTKTQGGRRSYRSPNLKIGEEYKYRVKAVLVRNGKELVRTRLVTMKPGQDETVRFSFAEVAETELLPAPMTSLTLRVPDDAKVTLCGTETKRRGTLRTFSTQSLESGKVWKDYTVQVEFERDGKPVVEERTLDMKAGETYSLSFGTQVTSPDRVAAK